MTGGGPGQERPPTEYTDFLIEFVPSPSGDWYSVKATCRESEREAEAAFALGDDYIADVVPKSELAVYGKAVDRTRASKMLGFEEDEIDEEDLLLVQDVGRDLHRAVFDGPIRDFFRDRRRDSGPLRLRIKLDLKKPGHQALSRLPWESLLDPEAGDLDFLAADFRTPVVREMSYDEPCEPARVDGVLRVLVLTANPPGTTRLPGLKQEQDVILDSFDELQRNGVLEYDHIAHASLEKINEHLRDRSDYHVLHYMGHGDYKGGQGLLLLHGTDEQGNDVADPVDSGKLALHLRGRCEGLRLVFLNACNTGIESRGDDDRQGVGVATSLLREGIPAVIAMQYEMQDKAAVTFAKTLYRQLAKFKPLEEAVSDARKDVLSEESGSDRKTSFWLTPVLYMRRIQDGGGVFERGSPVGGDPPESVDPGADFPIWLTEYGGRLVINWRVRARPGYEDFVALFDGEPDDDEPDGYYRAEKAPAGQPSESTRVFWTSVPAERGRWYAAYVNFDADPLIRSRFGPY